MMTRMGKPLDLTELDAFGRAENRFHRHGIGVGGEIVPQREPYTLPYGEKESSHHERGQSEGSQETRPEARSWQRQGSSPAGGPTGSQTVECELTAVLGLEALLGYYPGWSWSSDSSDLGYLRLPVQPFVSLPYRGSLVIEIPKKWPFWLFSTRIDKPNISVAPHLRAWAWWDYGIPVRSHHVYPDQSMCTHMPGQWGLGKSRLVDYAAMAVLWIGKSLHSQLLGSWPGLQHYESAQIRLQRDDRSEYCGCGSDKTYENCCRESDMETSAADRLWWLYQVEGAYMREIARRHWPVRPQLGF